LNNTEFGFYMIKKHSNVPLVSAITPTQFINPDLSGPLTTVFVLSGMPPQMAAEQAAGLWGLATAVQTHGPGAVPPEALAILTSPDSQGALEAAGQFAFFDAAATARYQVEYPEDITIVMASALTQISETRVGPYRENSPTVPINRWPSTMWKHCTRPYPQLIRPSPRLTALGTTGALG
jgi:hypothetical protein